MTNTTIYDNGKILAFDEGLLKEREPNSHWISHGLHGIYVDTKNSHQQPITGIVIAPVVNARIYFIYKTDDDRFGLEELMPCFINEYTPGTVSRPSTVSRYRTVASGDLQFVSTQYEKHTGFPPILTDDPTILDSDDKRAKYYGHKKS